MVVNLIVGRNRILTPYIMAKSEIDDIFAAKDKAKVTLIPPVASTSSVPEKKTKKRKSRNTTKPDADGDEVKPSSKRRIPQTVVDPSTRLEAPPPKRPKITAAKGLDSSDAARKKDKSKKSAVDEARFKDSRGAGPRRRTDDGFSVYKEDELGISNEGGDTPLCPFDCQCCF